MENPINVLMLEALKKVQRGHIGGQVHYGDDCDVCRAIAKADALETPPN
jgi:hypothetical protein